MRGAFRLVPVQPPKDVPIQALAAERGLVPGLRVETARAIFCCGGCREMRPAGSESVWIPDGVRLSDPAWAIAEQCRLSAFNGNFSLYCIGCAPKLETPPIRSLATAETRAPAPQAPTSQPAGERIGVLRQWWRSLWT